MLRKVFFITCFTLPLCCCVIAQESYEEYLKARKSEYSSYKKKAQEDFAAYRAKVKAEYTQFMRERWKAFSGEEPIPVPKQEPPVPPTIAPQEEQNRPAVDRPVVIDKIIQKPLAPISVPQPVVQIDKEPQPLPGRSDNSPKRKFSRRQSAESPCRYPFCLFFLRNGNVGYDSTGNKNSHWRIRK